MHKTKLVLVEGLCGSGKTTTAARLGEALSLQGIPARAYDEGALPHPVSLNWHAYLRPADLTALRLSFPREAGPLLESARAEGEAYLVPYRGVRGIPEGSPLWGFLRERELCYTNRPTATMHEYSHAVQASWGRFAQNMATAHEVAILEGVLLQHPIHDLVRNYSAGAEQIVEHMEKVLRHIAPLHPVLIYLAQSDVPRHQQRVAQERGKAHYGSEENIRRMIWRRALEERLLRSMPFDVLTIRIDDLDWERATQEAVAFALPHV